MLVIEYRGDKPIQDRYNFAVQGDNNSRKVQFIVSKLQDNIDLSSCKVYVKAQTPDKVFLDKKEITSSKTTRGNELLIEWTMESKHTEHRYIDVALEFDLTSNEMVWQTRLVRFTIANCVASDEEIENTYPSIIQSLLDRVEELESKPSGVNDVNIKFVHIEYGETEHTNLHTKQDPYTNVVDNNADYADPEQTFIVFETDEINSTIEEEIATGRFAIRFDRSTQYKPYSYMSMRRGKQHRPHGHGIKTFPHTLYTTPIDEEEAETIRNYDQLVNSFLFITTSDIKTNGNGCKYLYIKRNMVQLANKFWECWSNDLQESKTQPFVAPSSQWVADFKSEAKNKYIGGAVMASDGNGINTASINRIVPNNGSTPNITCSSRFYCADPIYRCFVPLTIDIDGTANVSLTTGLSRYACHRSEGQVFKTGDDDEFIYTETSSFRFVRSTDNSESDVYSNTRNKLVLPVSVRPRCVLLKSGYATIGSGTALGQGTMFEKVYSQGKQSIFARVNSAVIYDGEGDGNMSVFMLLGIGRKKQ